MCDLAASAAETRSSAHDQPATFAPSLMPKHHDTTNEPRHLERARRPAKLLTSWGMTLSWRPSGLAVEAFRAVTPPAPPAWCSGAGEVRSGFHLCGVNGARGAWGGLIASLGARRACPLGRGRESFGAQVERLGHPRSIRWIKLISLRVRSAA